MMLAVPSQAIISELTRRYWWSSIAGNTPAMPLSEAHFGGFFVSEVCR